MLGTVVAAAAVAVFGVMLIEWARACRRGEFRRSWVVGYRTPLTLRDDRAWAAAHRAAAPFVLLAGIGTLASGAAAAALAAVRVGEVVPLLLGGAIVWSLAWVVIGGFPAVRASRAAVTEGDWVPE
ncbi:SdpI family protein [Leucobacter aridicollis]|uniref:Fatty acid desaturase n=1 Tax=Leucobacter aridicollis TaxID=283878 RepID=A0A852RGA3_9MICO|nr:SdpI family protein [Leucobacter aridicollis]MBL3682316.1 hypothetical protein [Leucobacter aridicollis]NYD25732.1 fatty acid desaturase [Leucobacter aridicollis]